MISVGINGFGRIGRLVYRALAERPDQFDVKLVNDLSDAPILATLLKMDSTYGRYPGHVRAADGHLQVDGNEVRLTKEKDPSRLPWGEAGVDIVLECSGKFTSREGMEKHLEAGAPRVLLSAPAKGDNPIDQTVILGVNEQELRSDMKLVSAGSCTTNCVVPLAKVLHDAFGIEDGLMTTVHAYTNDQSLLDGIHKDPRRARAAASNIVPTSTGAAELVGKIIPELEGKLSGYALRVPVACGSVTDLTVTLKKNVSIEDVNAAYREAAQGALGAVLEYSEDPLVSSDIVGNAHSCIYDAGQTKVANGKLVKVLGWYDNEWGYSARLTDVTQLMGQMSQADHAARGSEQPEDRPGTTH